MIYLGVDVEKKREELLNSEAAKMMLETVISRADSALKKTYPALKMSEYMMFHENGNRKMFERPYFERRNDCSNLSIAYWLTEDEKYVNTLIDLVYMICDEFTWCLPAHTNLDYTPECVEDVIGKIDLFQSETARLLTDIVVLVGDKLPPCIKDRVRYEIRRRIVNPMFKYKHGWQSTGNNWAAVCAGGTAIAVFRYATKDEIEKLLPIFNYAINNYLDGFKDDGCCFEGYSYWNYGFGYFLLYAAAVYDYTNGKVDFFKSEKVKEIALFSQRIRLHNDRIVSISDGGSNYSFSPGIISLLREKYGDQIVYPNMKYLNLGGNVFSVRELLWFDTEYKEDTEKRISHYFSNAEWYVSNKEKYGFAAKGGSNYESHNHNDTGSFMIVTDDDEMPLADLGCAEYIKDTFRIETRYKFINNGSHGHNLPIINEDGYQLYGPEYRAKNVYADGDKFSMDIEGAYEPGIINKIHRAFKLSDDSVKLVDTFDFSEQTETVMERFVSWFKPEICDGEVKLGRATVKFDKNRYEASVSTDSYRNHAATADVTVYLVDIKGKDRAENYFEFDILV